MRTPIISPQNHQPETYERIHKRLEREAKWVPIILVLGALILALALIYLMELSGPIELRDLTDR